MTYKINGTELSLQPTNGAWQPKKSFGIDGTGHIIYSSVREFRMEWDIMSASDFSQLQGFYDLVGTTGTVVVDLPEYGASAYGFKSYSGCTLREPELGAFFEEHAQSVSLLVMNIKT